MTNEELMRLMQQLGYSDPSIEPPPLPSASPGGPLGPHQGVDVPPSTFQGNYFPPNVPHQGVDVPGGVFPEIYPNVPGQVQISTQNNPIYPDTFPPTFAPNYWGGELPPININDPSRNIATNETMYPSGRYFLPDQANWLTPGAANDTFDLPSFGAPQPPGDFDTNPAQAALAPGDSINQGGFTGMTPLPPDLSQEIYGNYSPFDFQNPPPNENAIPQSSSVAWLNMENPAQDVIGWSGDASSPGNQNYYRPNDDGSQFQTEFPTPSDNWPYTYNVGDEVYTGTGGAPSTPTGESWGDPDFGGFTETTQGTMADEFRFTEGDTGGSSAPGEGEQGIYPNQPSGGPFETPTPETGANSILGRNPYSYGPPSTPGGPMVQPSQAMYDNNGDLIPGTQLSAADAAKRYNTQQFNDPRYQPSDLLHPGQTFVKLLSDGTRVVVDAAGKIISGAVQAGQDLYHNITNDFRNTDPDYLRSIGYNPGQGTGSLYPASVTGPIPGPFDVGASGVGGQGGSFFHGSQYNPVDVGQGGGPIDLMGGSGASFTGGTVPDTDRPASAMNPQGYNFPRHGPTSLPGGGGAFGAGSRANAAALGGGNWQTRMNYVLRNIAGGTRGYKYPAPVLTNAFNTYEYRKLLESRLGIPANASSTPVNTPGAAANFAKEVQQRGYLFPGHPDLPPEGPRGFARQGFKQLGMGPQTPSGPLGHKPGQVQPV